MFAFAAGFCCAREVRRFQPYTLNPDSPGPVEPALHTL